MKGRGSHRVCSIALEHAIRWLAALSAVSAPVLAGVLWLGRPPEPPPSAPLDATEAAQLADLAHALALVARAAPCADCPTPADDGFGRLLAQEARAQLTRPDPGFRDDCSGFVSAVLTASGVPADGVVSSLYDLAVEHGAIHWSPVPRVGDLVFFDDTHDRDGDGRWDDPLTHIGLVIDVEPDGTALYAHAGTSRGRAIGRIHAAFPRTHRDASGKVLNTYLREPEPGDPPVAGYLSGALWVGFATVDPTQDWLTPPPPPETWP